IDRSKTVVDESSKALKDFGIEDYSGKNPVQAAECCCEEFDWEATAPMYLIRKDFGGGANQGSRRPG
ncbi:hypothetical protein U1Q18_042226, partial [Sarracenia purpurea var. burkii]